jgi:hypothetical protein
MTDLMTAADTAGLSTNVTTILVAFVGIAVLFVAARYIKRALAGR